jgi:hypothetical protein
MQRCAYQIRSHILIPVKYQKPLLSSNVLKKIAEGAQGKTEWRFIETQTTSTDSDYIHP